MSGTESGAPTGRALVTGAGQGLGLELYRELASRGWKVLGLVRTEEAADELRGMGPGRVEPVRGDVRDPGLEQVLAPALENLSGLELLVNNAGISGQGHGLAETDPENVADLLQVHCVGALRCARAARPFLLAGVRPLILNITSRMGSLERNLSGDFQGFNPSYGYRVAKAAQNMLTVCLSTDPTLNGISCAAVHPGSLRTAMGYPSAPNQAWEAARLLADLADSRPPNLDGAFLDLFSGEPIPW